jgi:hypothetical protein
MQGSTLQSYPGCLILTHAGLPTSATRHHPWGKGKNRTQPPRSAGEAATPTAGALFHQGRPANHDVPIGRARQRRGRVFRDGRGQACVLPPLGIGTVRGEEGCSRRRKGGGGEGGGGGAGSSYWFQVPTSTKV